MCVLKLCAAGSCGGAAIDDGTCFYKDTDRKGQPYDRYVGKYISVIIMPPPP